jgi:hypothetical protein
MAIGETPIEPSLPLISLRNNIGAVLDAARCQRLAAPGCRQRGPNQATA